jgi:hypothetical protein
MMLSHPVDRRAIQFLAIAVGCLLMRSAAAVPVFAVVGTVTGTSGTVVDGMQVTVHSTTLPGVPSATGLVGDGGAYAVALVSVDNVVVVRAGDRIAVDVAQGAAVVATRAATISTADISNGYASIDIEMAASLAILDIEPSPVPGFSLPQWIVIRGLGFDPMDSVVLHDGIQEYRKSPGASLLMPVWFIGPEETRVCVNVTDATNRWTVRIRKEDGSESSPASFQVDAGIEPSIERMAMLNAAFDEAATRFQVPSNLLRAIAWVESRWHQEACGLDGGFGMMQLTDPAIWDQAAAILRSEIPDFDRLAREPFAPGSARANIFGAAAILDSWWRQHEAIAPPASLVDPNAPRAALESWWWFLPKYNGGGGDGALKSSNYPFRVYHALREGVPGVVAQIDVSLPDATSRAPEPREEGEVASGDTNLFPIVHPGHIRVVDTNFQPSSLILHDNEGSPILPSVVGDVDGSGDVDITDLVHVAAAFGVPGPALGADLNGDGVVDILDLVLVASHFGNRALVAAPSSSRETVRASVGTWVAEARRRDDGARAHARGLQVLTTLHLVLDPRRTRLLANYPNPFNPETWIPFALSEESDVTIDIYDIAGSPVRSLSLGRLPSGRYSHRDRAAYWDGRDTTGVPVASGVYVYELRAGNYRELRRMVVRK